VRKDRGVLLKRKRKKGRKDCLFINQNQANTLYPERCILPKSGKIIGEENNYVTLVIRPKVILLRFISGDDANKDGKILV
jgi:hypothetical protein